MSVSFPYDNIGDHVCSMNEHDLWRTLAWGYFICINLSVAILVETVVLGFPYITLFLLILAATLTLNMRLLKK